MERGLWRYIKQSNPSGSSGENILAATYKFPSVSQRSIMEARESIVEILRIEGNLIAPEGPSSWKGKDRRSWLYFANVNGFTVNGNGEIDGQGSQWWKLCSDDATLSNLHISAPESSPNTDGIDISASQNIHILNSNIATGDDCIAINTGSSQINVTGLTCGPGHGISIGSLGKQGEAAAVEEVHVKNCTLNATQNGLRIKTWQGGSGYARKITFNDITLTDVDNPIIIDQFYCPHEQCSNETNAVKISDVSYTGIHGTSITQDAIALNCSRTVGCDNIVLEHIHIASSNSKEGTYSTCINAHGKCDDSVPSVGCLK
ncbi:Pectin lyase-like superfamily protein [Citrus sinensis]|nr:Pectin lyase-like superfamily protein [Citrus sinensis]